MQLILAVALCCMVQLSTAFFDQLLGHLKKNLVPRGRPTTRSGSNQPSAKVDSGVLDRLKNLESTVKQLALKVNAAPPPQHGGSGQTHRLARIESELNNIMDDHEAIVEEIQALSSDTKQALFLDT